MTLSNTILNRPAPPETLPRVGELPHGVYP